MMKFLLLAALVSIGYCYVDYTGDSVFRIKANSHDDVLELNKLALQYDIWHEARSVGEHVDVHIPKKKLQLMKQWLLKHNMDYTVMVEDVGELIANEKMTNTPRDARRLDFYRTLDEVNAWLDSISAAFPELTEVLDVATSYEGRTIRLLKISSGPGKPAFWMDSGIHSREWVAPATTIYYADAMLNGFGNDPEITALLNDMDFYVLPVFNVDGYAYTWSDDRLWRKTRSPNAGSTCVGTDPNRNWDIMWNEVAAGGPCTQTFPGASAFSEVEVREVVDFMNTIPDVIGVLAIHSYGQMYMVSYGYTTSQNPDYDEQMEVCNEAISALREVHGQNYRCDSLINLVGPNSGSSADYTYAVMGIKFSFGVELRDTGTFGFVLPENQIVPTGEENFEATKVIARAAYDDFLTQQ